MRLYIKAVFPNLDTLFMKLLTLLSVLLVLGLSISFAENHDWELARTLTLKFDYSRHYPYSQYYSKFSVTWNGKTVATITPSPSTWGRQSYKVSFTAQPGWNQLGFQGEGKHPSIGALISNVKLLRPSGYQDQ